MITRELIGQKLADLERQRRECENTLVAIGGAEQALTHLLGEIDRLEAQNRAEALADAALAPVAA